MKKLIAIFMAAVICLSLVACGSGKEPNQSQGQSYGWLCQEWKSIATGHVISFDSDGYFHINRGSYAYRYDADASKILVTVGAGTEVSLAVTLVDGIYRINVDGEEYAPASAYEQLYAEYAKNMMVIPSFDGLPALNEALLGDHIDRVELTVENWSDYIKEYSYEVEVIEKDPFGEVTNTEKVTVYRLGYGTGKYYCLSATIELKHKDTGELRLFGTNLVGNLVLDIGATSQEPFHLEEYECNRIQGYMYFIDYPDDVFEKVINVYDRSWADRENASITVTSDGSEGYWSVDTDAWVIESNSDNWANLFE